MSILSTGLAVGSGGLVGFSLGLIGGGGSILATPLLLYVVGLSPPHLAIGTGALAVAANAFLNFSNLSPVPYIEFVVSKSFLPKSLIV